MVIPAPTDADRAIDLKRAYACTDLLLDPGGEVARSFIRLLAAERAGVERLKALLNDKEYIQIKADYNRGHLSHYGWLQSKEAALAEPTLTRSA